MKVLVTGCTGFVGSALANRLAGTAEFGVVGSTRTSAPLASHPWYKVGELGPDTDWQEALRGVDSVVHSAARVHVMSETSPEPFKEFRRVNVEGTLNLASQAIDAGVGRFVFLSSIKVNGEGTLPGRPFSAGDIPSPADPYAESKLAAERGLAELGARSGMGIVIIRPPLVYGPGVGGNFASMVRWVATGLPLPLGRVDNKRSLVALPNLVDLIIRCLSHPDAVGEVFLVSDDDDLSTTQLLRRISLALGKRPRLVSVPQPLLVGAAALVGKSDMAQRLFGSLQVDMARTKEVLHWAPPVPVDQGIREAIKAAAS